MPAAAGHLVELEQQLAGLLMEFEFLSAAWPKPEHLRRLDTMVADDDHEQALLVASVLAVVERVA